jgi:hypothetical protein
MATATDIYINAYSAISAQDSFYKKWEPQLTTDQAFKDALEPVYKDFLPRKQLRRMSRVLRMGLTTALQALEQAGELELDAIVLGTAWGCVQDTEKFLEALIVNQEQYLTPTAFVQSTHNTVAGQIALFHKTNGYNMTHVQGKLSFESALVDAYTLLEQASAKNVLVNGLDELTSNLKIMLKRLHCASPQQPMGEGASCFILSQKATENSLARLVGVGSAYLPKGTPLQTASAQLTQQIPCDFDRLDVVLCGQAALPTAAFAQAECCSYTALCGNYPTNSAFAMGLGIELLQGNTAVQNLLAIKHPNPQHIGIYNREGRKEGLIVLEKIAQ